MYIENINSPEDVKKLKGDQLVVLAQEMRTALIEKLSKRGGHFGPNLGFVEATIALHYVFDSPRDKIVFDVSHQCYPHKMLTGRKDAYLYEEHYGDVSGYSNPNESEHDNFIIGHTSTSVSLACGLAKARDLKGESGNVIAVIGDGSLSGGEALEGLDFAAELGGNLIIVVNDNDMSIAENHGGLYQNLKLLRETGGKAETNLFKAMGLDYVYVDGGNDISRLIKAFSSVKDAKKPVVVHINTLKGKGFAPSEKNKENWHYCAPFDIKTGNPKVQDSGKDYSDVSYEYLSEKMEKDKKVVVITSGTPTVMGFTAERRKKAGKQFVDVGIAEETAVALASGIATGGGKPVYGVYSSFIQRTYDQLTQDLCINKSPATIAVFAGSVYGMRDITHIGFQDIPMLSNIPNLVYLAPTCSEEYLSMLNWAVEQTEYPVAIKVPGKYYESGKTFNSDYGKLNSFSVAQKGEKVAILGLGTFFETAEEAAKIIEENAGFKPTVINPRFISGLDVALLEELKKNHKYVITLEDGYFEGGFGSKIAAFYGNSDIKVLNFGLKKQFLDRYDVEKVLQENGLTVQTLAENVLKLI